MKSECNAWIFENAVAEPDDPWLRDLSLKPVTLDRNVYHVACGPGQLQQMVESAIADASSALPLVGFGWSFAAPPLSPRAALSMAYEGESIRAEHLREIVVGCYDGEAFLLWMAPGWG